MADLDQRVTNKMANKLILASKSPRRRGFFDMLGLDYTAISPDVDESADPSLTAEKFVQELAKSKAMAIDSSDAYVISADTVVVQNGVILGKPKDKQDAENMLRSYSESSHEVITGCAIKRGDKIVTFATVTRVYFKKLTEDQINSYINTDEPYDKAGGYGIQGIAGLFVSKIDGDYNNVVGLPLCDLDTAMWENFKLRLTDFKK